MKRLFSVILGTVVLMMTACTSEFDDSRIWDELKDHEDRILKLETLCKGLNNDLTSLQTIVNSIKDNVYITGVAPVTENGIEVGTSITFSNGNSFVIRHGRDGEDGPQGPQGTPGMPGNDGEDGRDGYTPVIGVRQDTDGVWCWTLDGEWLLDGNDEKLRVEGEDGTNGTNGTNGNDGVTPRLKIEDGYWTVSYDNGSSWETLGVMSGNVSTTSFFSDVTYTDFTVRFVLNDGVVLDVPRNVPLNVNFDTSDLLVMGPDSTRDINFSISPANRDYEFEVITSADIKAEVVRTGGNEGCITINTTSTVDKYSKVVLLVSDGMRMVMKTLRFEAEAIVVEGSDELTVSHEGGELSLYFLSNVSCRVSMPKDADWLHLMSLKSMQEHEIVVYADPNTGMPRTADVRIISESGLSILYTIRQESTADMQEQLERETLIKFYSALGGSNWVEKTNWCSDKPIGEWYGISVIGEGEGRAINMNLQNNNLSGEIPASFWKNLPLRNVYLDNNQIKGDVSADVAECRTMRQLSLSGNSLSGRLPIEAMQNLNVYVNLSYNQYTGTLPAEIAPYIDRMYIYCNYFYGDIPAEITGHELWQYSWMNVTLQYPQNNGLALNMEGVVIPGPAFEGYDNDGNLIDYRTEYEKNELTVLINWSSSNPTMLNMLRDMYQTYNAHGVEIYSWNEYDNLDTINGYLASNPVPWSDLIMQGRFYSLTWDSMALVIDRNGELVYHNLDTGDNVLDFIDNYISGASEYVSTDYSQDGLVYQLQRATEGNGIDIVLMGDGYSDRMIASGEYRQVMEDAMEYLFVEEPYRSYRHLFNVYMVNAVSATEILDGSTAFSTYFGDGTFVGGNGNTVASYALKAIPEAEMDEATLVVMINSRKYAGTCWMYYPDRGDAGYGLSISYFPVGVDGEAFKQVLNHETCGHGFGKLADEYSYQYMGTIPQQEVELNQYYEPYGWYRNVDYTNNRAQVKWAHFLNDPRYANEGLGVFEGGCTYWRGVWRSTENSIMRDNVGGFNAPSREAIWYRIHRQAYGDSWTYNYEDFVAYDAINRTQTSRAMRRAQAKAVNYDNFEPLAPPVIVGKTWREAMNNF